MILMRDMTARHPRALETHPRIAALVTAFREDVESRAARAKKDAA